MRITELKLLFFSELTQELSGDFKENVKTETNIQIEIKGKTRQFVSVS
jgi:hypothetical protein